MNAPRIVSIWAFCVAVLFSDGRAQALSPTSNLLELQPSGQLSQLSDDDYRRRIIEIKDQIASSLRDLKKNPITGRNRLRELLPLFFQLGLPEALKGRSYTVE